VVCSISVSTTSRLVLKSSTSWEENPEAAATVAPITNAVEAMIDQSAPRRGWRTRPTRLGVGGVRITRRLLSIGSDGHQRVYTVLPACSSRHGLASWTKVC